MFKYLGRLLAYNDNNTQAMRANLVKARKSWGRVSCVLRAENASPKVCGVFYKATVQAVIGHGIGGINIPSKWRDSLKACRRSKQ